MDGNKAVLDLGRTNLDALNVFDLTATIGATGARPAHLVVMGKAGNQFALEFVTRVQVDLVVNRLVRDRFFGVIGPHGSQYVRNLLRRPELFEVSPDHLKERAIDVELGRPTRCDTPSIALLVSEVGMIGPILETAT